MRILFVIHNFLPYSRTGVENYTFTLSKMLMKRHTVLVYSAIFDPLKDKYSPLRYFYNSIEVESFYHDSIFRNFSETISNRLLDERFTDVIKRFRPDVVHFQHQMFHSVGYADILRKQNIPSVLTLHDFHYYCPNLGQRLFLGRYQCHNKFPLKCALCFRTSKTNISKIDKIVYEKTTKISLLNGLGDKIPYIGYFIKGLRLIQLSPLPEDIIRREIEMLNFLGKQDAIISPSLYYKDFYEKFTGHKNIIHLDYGFDKPEKKTFSKEKRDRLTLGFVGTISRHKGAHLIIDLAKKLRESIKILIWGNDKNDKILSKRLKSLENIEYKGEFEPDRKEEAYRSIDYLIVPSIWEENSPLVIHESLLYNTPVIASDRGGNRELIREGENGFLFDPSEKDSLLALLDKILRENIRIKKVDNSVVMNITNHSKKIEELYKTLQMSKEPKHSKY